MMRRLFWRIFAAFWLAAVLMLLAFAWVTMRNFENQEIPGLGITRLQAAMDDKLGRAARQLRREGEPAVRAWLGTGDPGPIEIYVYDAGGHELLGRVPPEPGLSAALGLLRAPPAPEGTGSVTIGSGRMRARTIRMRDAPDYVAVATLEGGFLSRLVSRPPHALWMHLAIAMFVSAMVSLLLAAYVTAPLARIRRSTRRIAEGDLDARVGRLRFGRSAEIAALASEFDGMAERIKALVESHRRLVRDVSHELRSPLARLRVALELGRGGEAPVAEAAFDRIEREADRLEGMLAQSLELSRLETSEGSAHDEIELDALLEDVITNAAYEGAPRGRKVVLAERERLRLTGSHAALHSAFENVIRNALAYTADGSTVAVRLARDPARADLALISVRDHGPGVPPAELERIFEPFYRTDSARTRGSGGTGLGLAIAQRAIQRHRGSILARNAEGGGLEVEIRLPLARG
ncbi:MAG TPA: ATP-binding protein [Dokdonella sp.]